MALRVQVGRRGYAPTRPEHNAIWPYMPGTASPDAKYGISHHSTIYNALPVSLS